MDTQQSYYKVAISSMRFFPHREVRNILDKEIIQEGRKYVAVNDYCHKTGLFNRTYIFFDQEDYVKFILTYGEYL